MSMAYEERNELIVSYIERNIPAGSQFLFWNLYNEIKTATNVDVTTKEFAQIIRPLNMIRILEKNIPMYVKSGCANL